MGLNREIHAYNARVRKLAITIPRASLTNVTNGAAQSITLGTLPKGATVLATSFRLTAQFTGGGATAVGVTLGDTARGVNALGSAINAFGGTVAPVLYSPPTTPGTFAGPYAADDTAVAIFTPDGAHNLAALTAGSIDIEIVYAIADTGY